MLLYKEAGNYLARERRWDVSPGRSGKAREARNERGINDVLEVGIGYIDISIISDMTCDTDSQYCLEMINERHAAATTYDHLVIGTGKAE